MFSMRKCSVPVGEVGLGHYIPRVEKSAHTVGQEERGKMVLYWAQRADSVVRQHSHL
jgi:hypothetical protein